MKVIATMITGMLLATSASAACLEKRQLQAFNIRALQSSMMVAALSCAQQDNYNRFIAKYKKPFKKNGKVVEGYFKEAHGSGYKSELNRFVTTLANKATERSMFADPNQYCPAMQERYEQLLTAQGERLLNTMSTRQQFSALHEFEGC